MVTQPADRFVAPDSSEAPSLFVVTVTYNSADTLAGLLDSLAAGLDGIGRTEVVIIDNDSSDDTVDIARAHPIGPKVIPTGRNGGYAAGINAGTAGIPQHADILILNPDIRLGPGSVLPLFTRLRDPDVGIVAPRILHEDGSISFSLHREPSLLTGWADALLGGRLSGRIDIGEVIRSPSRYRRAHAIEWASGAALLISGRARRAVGDWDESFFLYSEEVDYQRRVRDAGLSIAYVPESALVHVGGDYQRNPRLYGLLTANRIRYFGRHHGPAATAAFRLGVLAGEALRSWRGSAVHRAGVIAARRRQTVGGLSDG